MNKTIFRDNLLKVIKEILIHENVENDIHYKFSIVPIQEEGKTYNTKDDVMRLMIFSDDNIKGRYLDLETVATLFSTFEPLYPLWINVLLTHSGEDFIFELRTSLRFRKPSVIKNQETGHPPFYAIISSGEKKHVQDPGQGGHTPIK